MSLNKLVTEGKISDGIDLDIRSLNTAPDAGNNIGGSLSVVGFAVFQNDVSMLRDLEILGNVTIDGLPVVLTGTQSGTVIVSSNLDTASRLGSYTFSVLGGRMQMQGVFVASLASYTGSRIVTMTLAIPSGYTVNGSYVNRYAPVTGNANFIAAIAQAGWNASSCNVLSGSSAIIYFTNNNNINATVGLGSQLIFNFTVYFDNVTKN